MADYIRRMRGWQSTTAGRLFYIFLLAVLGGALIPLTAAIALVVLKNLLLPLLVELQLFSAWLYGFFE
jgi:hypothetical protein